MSQNSNSTTSSDSDVLYSLNTDYDSNGSDISDLSGYDLEDNDENDVHYIMESDSEDKTESDSDQADINLEDINMDVAAIDDQNIQWSKQTKFEPDLPVFGETFMLKDDIDLPKSPSPYDFLNLFLTTEIVDYIVHQSNLYCIQQNLKQEPMTNLDLYHLIGFLFYSSLCTLPCKSDYWASTYGHEIVMKNISRNRLDQLLRSLHFGNNILQKQPDDKIQPLIDLFNNRCGSVVKQEQNLSIDEQMIRYKGQRAPKNYKQYMPKKPIKRGFKLWSLSGVSAYTYRIKLYRGADTRIPVLKTNVPSNRTTSSALETRSKHRNDKDNEDLIKQYDDIKRYGKSGMVVIDLLRDVLKGSNVFTDNYFGSVELLHKMTTLGYGLTCTLKEGRIKKCPIKSQRTMAKYPRGYYDYLISNDKRIIIVAWQDNKRVLMGSNFVGIEPIVQLSRWDKNQQQKVIVDAPQIVKTYNKNMGGVDKVDMLCALHPIPFRSKKWYMRIAWRIFDLMVINAWVLWKHMLPDDKQNWRSSRLFYFKMAIANLMLRNPNSIERQVLATNDSSSESGSDDNDINPRKRRRETVSHIPNMVRFDGLQHWPQIQQNLRLRCKNEGCSMKTITYCSKCQIHLCLNPMRNCFKDYHCKN